MKILSDAQELAIQQLNQLVIMPKFQKQTVLEKIKTSEESAYFCEVVAELFEVQKKLIEAKKQADETGQSGNVLAHIFAPTAGYDLYLMELDLEYKTVFGYARFQHCIESFEAGSTSLEELFSAFTSPFNQPELDFNFTEKPWADIKKEENYR